MKILWGIKRGNAFWQEEIITTNEARIEEAITWAKNNDFVNLRISELKEGVRDHLTASCPPKNGGHHGQKQ